MEWSLVGDATYGTGSIGALAWSVGLGLTPPWQDPRSGSLWYRGSALLEMGVVDDTYLWALKCPESVQKPKEFLVSEPWCHMGGGYSK